MNKKFSRGLIFLLLVIGLFVVIASDLLSVQIDYTTGTEEDTVNKSQSFIFINVTTLNETRINLQTLEDPKGQVRAVSFSPNQLLAVGSNDTDVYIYKTADWTLNRTLNQTDIIMDVQFSPNGDYLATSSEDDKVLIYNTTNWSVISTLTQDLQLAADTYKYNVLSFSPNGLYLGSVGINNQFHIYNTTDWSLIQTLADPSIYSLDSTSISFSRDNEYVGTTTYNNTFIYKTSDWSVNQTIELNGKSISFSPTQDYMSISVGGTIYVYNSTNWSLIKSIAVAGNAIQEIMFSPDGLLLAAASLDSKLYVYNTNNWSLNETFTDSTDKVLTVDFSNNSEDLAFGGSDSKVYISLSRGNEIKENSTIDVKNITYYLYDNSPSLLQSSFFPNNTKEYNFTSLSDGFYYYNVTFFDEYNNTNSTETRLIGLDTTGPVITITSPEAITYAQNESLSLNYTSIDQTSVDSCWYNLINSTGGQIISNTTLSSCENSTFNISQGEGIYNLTVYSNDSFGQVGSQNVVFEVSLTAPSTVLDSPINNEAVGTSNVYLNFTSTDSDGIDTCELWSNFTGNWSLNETITSVSSGVQKSTLKTLDDNLYLWNVKCNDTLGNSAFALNNLTFFVDTTAPTINLSINTTAGSQTFDFLAEIIDLTPDTCKYSIYNSTGSIDGLSENISFICDTTSTATTTSYGDYTFRAYATDRVGLTSYFDLNFTTSPSAGGNFTGGGGTTIITEAANWTMEVSEGTKRYDVLLISGTARELAFNLENTGEENLTVTFSCVDLENDFCQYVNFTRDSISLPPIKDVKTTAFFTVTLPDTIDEEDAIFNIIGIDQNNRQNSITVDVSVGTQNFIVETLAKLGLKTKGGFPYIAIFLIPLVILFPLSIKFIKEDTPLRGLWIVLVGIGIPFLLVYLF